jgi:hypothetical protein
MFFNICQILGLVIPHAATLWWKRQYQNMNWEYRYCAVYLIKIKALNQNTVVRNEEHRYRFEKYIYVHLVQMHTCSFSKCLKKNKLLF